MRIPAIVDGVPTVVVGYGPGKTGPLAIVIWKTPDGGYCLRSASLEDVKPQGLPKKLRRQLNKAIPVLSTPSEA